MSMAIHRKTPAGKLIQSYMRTPPSHDFAAASMERLRVSVMESTSSRREAYKLMNPDLSLHFVYSPQSQVPEYCRTAFTRLRLQSHRLKIETGRWTRPVTPKELRQCVCKEVQTEEHILLSCPLTAELRSNDFFTQYTDIGSLFDCSDNESAIRVCKLCHSAINIFI